MGRRQQSKNARRATEKHARQKGRPHQGGPSCTCRNHLGKPKQQHRSRDQAISAIVRRHMRRGGTFRAYRCPTSPKWHVTSQEPRP